MKKDLRAPGSYCGIAQMMPHDEEYEGWVEFAGSEEELAAYRTYDDWIQLQTPITAAAMARTWGGSGSRRKPS